MKKTIIAGGKYAMFVHQGSYESLGNTYNYIFNQWLPSNDYSLRISPPFDKYLDQDPRAIKSEDLTTEIYIPLE